MKAGRAGHRWIEVTRRDPPEHPNRHQAVLHFDAKRGIGYNDVHLLMSTALAGNARLWTRDKRLHLAAADLGFADLEMH